MLAKPHRLTRSADFAQVHSQGRCWSDRMVVLCRRRNDLDVSRFGFSVSKRIGKAVARNRVRRLLREAIRLHCDLIAPGWDVVMIARRGIVGADYEAVERSVTHLLGQAHLYREAQAAPGRTERQQV